MKNENKEKDREGTRWRGVAKETMEQRNVEEICIKVDKNYPVWVYTSTFKKSGNPLIPIFKELLLEFGMVGEEVFTAQMFKNEKGKVMMVLEFIPLEKTRFLE